MKSTRRRAREFAIQAFYQFQLAQTDHEVLKQQFRDVADFRHADANLFERLVDGVFGEMIALEQAIRPVIDRRLEELSPVERGILWLAAYELRDCVDIPCRVIINEAIELAKSFGGTDGHKYVNGVLDKLALLWRPAEMRPTARTVE